MGRINTITDGLEQARREMRAIKAQGLTTDPRDAVVSYSFNATVQGIQANDINSDHGATFIFDADGIKDGTMTVPPMMNVWISSAHVPQNDFGIDEGSISLVRYNPTAFYVVCPFISVSTTDTYSISVHATALVPGDFYGDKY